MNGDTEKSENKIIAALAYLLGFITGIIFLYVEPYNQDDYVRFHARQSIGFSVAVLVIGVVFSVFIAVTPRALSGLLAVLQGLIDLALAIFWLFLMFKAYTGERYRIPELADIIDQVSPPKFS